MFAATRSCKKIRTISSRVRCRTKTDICFSQHTIFCHPWLTGLWAWSSQEHHHRAVQTWNRKLNQKKRKVSTHSDIVVCRNRHRSCNHVIKHHKNKVYHLQSETSRWYSVQLEIFSGSCFYQLFCVKKRASAPWNRFQFHESLLNLWSFYGIMRL